MDLSQIGEASMAQGAKRGEEKPAKGPTAQSVDRTPKDEAKLEEHSLPVDHEDGPKGHPTSDRFQTEQAHRTHEKAREKP
jgi:hypothetical protein